MPDRIVSQDPTVRRWRSDRLPLHWVFPEGSRLPWISKWATGPEPMNVTKKLTAVCVDVCQRCPAFAHIDMSRIRVTFTPSRNRSQYGLQAKLTPLKLKGGSQESERRGRRFRVQQFLVDEVELLYLVTFVLPRFLDRPFEDKLVTIFHELYHIGPAFDGDLRRHEGRYQFHSHSQREYDQHMAHSARQYLASGPDPSLHGFLRMSFAQLQQRHGTVTGIVVPRPKIIPLIGPLAAAAHATAPPVIP